jgi:hypothetical protein
LFSETVVVLVTGSGLARGAGTMLRRLAVRVALLIGFTAGAWLVGVLFAGPASADARLPLDLPGINLNIGGSSEQPSVSANATSSKKAGGAKSSGQGLLGGLVGGLVGTVTETVNTTVSTVTTTVNNTVSTVTTTVNNTVTTVTTTVNKTLGTVTKTVTNVVDGVTKLPEKILSPPAGSDRPLLPEPVTDLLDLGKKSDSVPTQTDTQRTDAVPVAETPAVAPAEAAPLAADAVPAAERPSAQTTQSAAHPVRVGPTSEKAAPADNRPGPLPSPTAPVAPAAPCPTFSSGGNGGSDARGTLAVLPLQTQLAPPLAGRLHQQDFAAESGRCAGLPATPPD